jgi:hypothetical protein
MGLARYWDLLEDRFDLAAGRAFEDAPLSAGLIGHNECNQHRVATPGARRRLYIVGCGHALAYASQHVAYRQVGYALMKPIDRSTELEHKG